GTKEDSMTMRGKTENQNNENRPQPAGARRVQSADPAVRASLLRRERLRLSQLFFEVTAKNAAASWCTRLPLHFGHLILPFSYSASDRMTSKGFLQSSQ